MWLQISTNFQKVPPDPFHSFTITVPLAEREAGCSSRVFFHVIPVQSIRRSHVAVHDLLLDARDPGLAGELLGLFSQETFMVDFETCGRMLAILSIVSTQRNTNMGYVGQTYWSGKDTRSSSLPA